jgi:hypothetical protein
VLAAACILVVDFRRDGNFPMELKFGILLVWVGLAFTVGVTANRRGRDGINWFTLAVLISPPLAALLVWLLPEKAPFDGEIRFDRPRKITQDIQPPMFEPDGFYAGIPYRVTPYNEIDAMVPSGIIRFQTIEHFLAAAEKIAA